MLIWPCDQEVATTLDLVVTCTQIKGWERNSTKVQGHSTSVKFLEVQWYGAFRDIPSKVKDNLLCLAPLTTKKEAQHPVCLFEFWIQQFLTWMCFSSLPIHQMLRNLLDLIEVWSRHSFWSWIFHSYMQCFLKSYHTWNYSTLATVMVFHKILLWSKELMSKLEKCNTLMVTESISHNPKAAGLTERWNGFLKTQLQYQSCGSSLEGCVRVP